MEIITDKISKQRLTEMAEKMFGNLVKGVVDVEKQIMAVDGELHADLQAYLIESGSNWQNLWGISLHPKKQGQDFIEFDSVINIRPSQNNRSRGVADVKIQEKIINIANKLVQK